MDAPRRRALPTEPERVVCIAALTAFAETQPFHHRQPMATVRMRQVDTLGAATLYCDCLHDGFHQWPPSLQPIGTRREHSADASTSDGIDEGEEFIQRI